MDTANHPLSPPATLRLERPSEDTLQVHLTGSWRLHDALPTDTEIQGQVEANPHIRRVTFYTQGLTAWDSGLLTFLRDILDSLQQHQLSIDQSGLPAGVQRLLALATAVPEREGAARQARRRAWLTRVGSHGIAAFVAATTMCTFLGEVMLTMLKFVTGKARYRRADLATIMQECGGQALGIVSLISLLIGLILAFMGAVQLRQFGAQIYVADLVGLGMTREMAAMMTAIIMAGRTGAAFAAQLGTMQVNAEIDALRTMGISPMEFLVLPRLLALVVMMPLLCMYANLLGLLGGLLVATGMLDLSYSAYLHELQGAVGLNDVMLGVCKSGLFGMLVAMAGCLRGMQCGRSAEAVGKAATSAVVMGIVLIIATDGLLAVLTEALGI